MKEMKRALWVVALATGLSSLAEAGAVPAVACSVSPLTTYLTSGFSCSIGSLTFSNFSYMSSSFNGATAIPAAGVEVTPITGSEAGFQFDAPWSVSSTQGLRSSIDYTVSGTITDLVLSIAGYGVADGGKSSAGETSASPPLSLLVFDNLTGTQATDSAAGLSLTSLSLVNKIAVFGNGGVATLSIVDDEFSTRSPRSSITPESSSVLLFATGLVALAGYFRRRHASKS